MTKANAVHAPAGTRSNTSAAIVAEIETLRADLRKVNDVIGIVGSAAVHKAKEIAAALDEANDRLAATLADELEQERKKRMAQFQDIEIVTSYSQGYDGNLVRAIFDISYTKLAYDSSLRQTVPQRHKCQGFKTLPDDAYEYLVRERPEVIPAEIMALAPDNANEAFRLYFLGLQRGMIRTAAQPFANVLDRDA